MLLTRRRLLALLPASVATFLLACSGDGDETQSRRSTAEATAAAPGSETDSAGQLAPTPACGDEDDDPTIAQTEGPFFTPNSPERSSLMEPGITGRPLVLEGVVVNTGCEPVAGALLDFWQADDAGKYDNQGFRLRGHQFAGQDGAYRLETILPGLYTGRTRHIHVKVQAPDRPVLTTQLYFPGEPTNTRDTIFNDSLLLKDYRDDSSGKSGRFQFVVNV